MRFWSAHPFVADSDREWLEQTGSRPAKNRRGRIELGPGRPKEDEK